MSPPPLRPLLVALSARVGAFPFLGVGGGRGRGGRAAARGGAVGLRRCARYRFRVGHGHRERGMLLLLILLLGGDQLLLLLHQSIKIVIDGRTNGRLLFPVVVSIYGACSSFRYNFTFVLVKKLDQNLTVAVLDHLGVDASVVYIVGKGVYRVDGESIFEDSGL